MHLITVVSLLILMYFSTSCPVDVTLLRRNVAVCILLFVVKILRCSILTLWYQLYCYFSPKPVLCYPFGVLAADLLRYFCA